MDNKNEWNTLSNFLSDMIIKYADSLDIEQITKPDTLEDISFDSKKILQMQALHDILIHEKNV